MRGEVIYLAPAMQFAGFRSVIGAIEAVDDGETSKVTSTFYKHMVDESRRLDHTRKSVHIPFDQRILYIHIGVWFKYMCMLLGPLFILLILVCIEYNLQYTCIENVQPSSDQLSSLRSE